MRSQPTDKGGRWIAATIQKRTRGPFNELGEAPETWVFVATKWARTTTISAKERLRADEDIVDDVSHVVDMRWFDGLTSTDHRLVINGLAFDITGLIDVDNLHRWWQISCNQTTQVVVPTITSVTDASNGGLLVTLSLPADLTTIDPAGFSLDGVAGSTSSPAGETAVEIGGDLWPAEPFSGKAWAASPTFLPGVPPTQGVVP